MKYVEFRELIQGKLKRNPAGLTWKELKTDLNLPYDRPCPTWLTSLEKDIALIREKGSGRALVWKICKN